jgi:hypothetical protein
MISNSPVIHERSNIIPINKKLNTYTKSDSPKGEYSLKQNFFDPSKSSPPNDFILKLHMRMNVYNLNPYCDIIKDDNLDKK